MHFKTPVILKLILCINQIVSIPREPLSGDRRLPTAHTLMNNAQAIWNSAPVEPHFGTHKMPMAYVTVQNCWLFIIHWVQQPSNMGTGCTTHKVIAQTPFMRSMCHVGLTTYNATCSATSTEITSCTHETLLLVHNTRIVNVMGHIILLSQLRRTCASCAS